MAVGGGDVAGVFVLGVQGVGGDHRVGEVESGQQGCERGDLVAVGFDLPLSHYGLGVVAGGGQQVHCGVGGAAAAQGLAVHGQAGELGPGAGPAVWGGGRGAVGERGQIGAGRGVEGIAIQAGQQPSQSAGGQPYRAG